MTITNGPNMGVIISASQGEEYYDELKKFLRAADGFLMPFAVNYQNSPPGSPNDGDLYIVASGTGAWVGQNNTVARWWSGGSAWEFFTPKTGWRVLNNYTGVVLYYNGSGWIPLPGAAIYKEKVTSPTLAITQSWTRTISGIDGDNNLVIVSTEDSALFDYSISTTSSSVAVTLTNTNNGSSTQITASILIIAS